ncbi:MAG: ABC transporter ATP-binding protein [Brooklawnia sp.]|uniref:ABC transporter ATP-binding protein n=1 Tax=Brooklawnia sp. TaxID=2699740 RepID=UPI003C717898
MSVHIEVDNVTKRFDTVTAISGLSLEVAHNEFVTVVGASGCGKTTLLSIVAGLTTPSSGRVRVDGHPITGPGRDRGVVFQQFTLLPWLTAQGNVEFALADEPMSPAERSACAREHLELVGLQGFEDAYPAQLSGGMQQRVAIARSLSYRPKILLMDEPFGALDALTRRDMQRLLTRIWEKARMTVLMITHDIEEALITSDRVVVVTPRPGRIAGIIDVPLPRPRSIDMIDDPEFRKLHHRVLHLVQPGLTDQNP